MSLTAVRTLFRNQLEGLGFEEHEEPFQPTQIGANIVNDSFHIQTGTITSGPAVNKVHSFDFPLVLRVYKRGFLDLLEAYDEIHQTADDILSNLLDQNVRIGSDVKDIVPDSIDILPIEDSNDNILLLELAFTARLELCYVT